MNRDSSSFGQWLKHRRSSLDLTQAELADRVGLSVVSMHKIETGERRPSKETAQRLAEVLGVPRGEQEAFVRFARAVYPDQLAGARPPVLAAAPCTPLPSAFLVPLVEAPLAPHLVALRACGARDLGQKSLALLDSLDAARLRGDVAGANRLAGELLACAENAEAGAGQRAFVRSYALWSLAEMMFSVDDDLAWRHADETLALARRAGLPLQAGAAQTLLGLIALRRADLDDARSRLREAAAWLRDASVQGLLDRALDGVGRVEIAGGDWWAVHAAFGELAAAQARLKRSPGWLRLPLEGLVAAAALAGDDRRAARLLGALEAAPDLPPECLVPQPWEPAYVPVLRSVRARLGEAAFAGAVAEGRRMTLEEALAYGLMPLR